MWNLDGPRLFATGTLLGSAAEAAAVGLLPSYENVATDWTVLAGGTVNGANGNTGLHGGGTVNGGSSSSVAGSQGMGMGMGGMRADSDGEEDSPYGKASGGVQPAAGAAGRGGRKKSILALNDPQAVYDAMQPAANLVSVRVTPVCICVNCN